MNAYLIAAFADELEKDAAMPQLLQRLRGGAGYIPHLLGKAWGHGLGRAALGGATGAAVGAATAPPEERARRAILGGLLGAGAGYAAPLATRAGRERAAEHAKYLGSKAKHEVTGLGQAPMKPGAKFTGKELDELRAAEAAGLTSVPGVIKGMATKPLQTLKSAWQGAGGLGKAMTLADVAMSVPHIRDPNTEEGTGSKVMGTLGRSTGYMLGGRMGLLGSSILGSGLGYLGGKAGKVFGGGNPQVAPPGALAAMSPRAEMLSQQAGRLMGPE